MLARFPWHSIPTIYLNVIILVRVQIKKRLLKRQLVTGLVS
jgi:hypothetical protein